MRLKGKKCKERAKNKGTGGHHGSKKRIAKRTKSTFVATATTTTCFYRLAVYRQFQEEHLSNLCGYLSFLRLHVLSFLNCRWTAEEVVREARFRKSSTSNISRRKTEYFCSRSVDEKNLYIFRNWKILTMTYIVFFFKFYLQSGEVLLLNCLLAVENSNAYHKYYKHFCLL